MNLPYLHQIILHSTEGSKVVKRKGFSIINNNIWEWISQYFKNNKTIKDGIITMDVPTT